MCRRIRSNAGLGRMVIVANGLLSCPLPLPSLVKRYANNKRDRKAEQA